MPRKPLSELSPAYRRRIESGLRRGQTRQEARGHQRSAGTSEYQRRMWRRAQALMAEAEGHEPTIGDKYYRGNVEYTENRTETIADLFLALGAAGAVRFLEAKVAAHRAFESFESDDRIREVRTEVERRFNRRKSRLSYVWLWYH